MVYVVATRFFVIILVMLVLLGLDALSRGHDIPVVRKRVVLSNKARNRLGVMVVLAFIGLLAFIERTLP